MKPPPKGTKRDRRRGGERRKKYEGWAREQEVRGGAVTDTNVGTDRSGKK
jgi:hypothetical protein